MNQHSSTSNDYQKKKAFFDSLLTVYGRKPVLEALQDNSLHIFRLHMANSNKPAGIIKDILELAKSRNIDIAWHDRKALSRISRNSKQDQGVAIDIKPDKFLSIEEFIKAENITRYQKIIALDGITNPQNLGMIIRSACAGFVDAILIPQKGCASLSPLVIKASAGTLFKAPIIYCETISDGLKALQTKGFILCTLSSHAKQSLFDYQHTETTVFILGNETEGVSESTAALANHALSIPMNNGVESLNVAVTAALIAFS